MARFDNDVDYFFSNCIESLEDKVSRLEELLESDEFVDEIIDRIKRRQIELSAHQDSKSPTRVM